MKTATFTLEFPMVKKDTDGNITGLDFTKRKYGIPACVISTYEFACGVQQYINLAYHDYFQWESDKQYARYEKTGIENDWNLYSEFAEQVEPDNMTQNINFEFLYAYVICNHVRTHYYRDSHGTYTKCGVAIGTYGTELFELFKTYAFSNINDKSMKVAREQLRAWFGDVIEHDSTCKAWDTKKISIDTTRQLINLAGKVQTKMRKDFSNKSTSIAEFTEQALVKCFQRCFKMKPAPVIEKTEKVYVIED